MSQLFGIGVVAINQNKMHYLAINLLNKVFSSDSSCQTFFFWSSYNFHLFYCFNFKCELFGAFKCSNHVQHYIVHSVTLVVSIAASAILFLFCILMNYMYVFFYFHQAPLEPKESVEGMLRVIGSLTEKQHGGFLDYTGETIPW